MKYKHIEACREARLWIGQIIVPAVVGGIMIMSNDQVRSYVNRKIDNTKNFVKDKFHK